MLFLPTTVAPPTITNDPDDLIVASGNDAVFMVMTTGEFLSFEWFKDNSLLSNTGNIGGATTNTLTLSPVDVSDAGMYRVEVSNIADLVTSSAASLTVGKHVQC